MSKELGRLYGRRLPFKLQVRKRSVEIIGRIGRIHVYCTRIVQYGFDVVPILDGKVTLGRKAG